MICFKKEGEIMGKKETVMVKVAYLVEVEKDEICSGESTIDQVISKIGVDETLDIEGKKVELQWIQTSANTLDEDKENCGKCSVCGAWTTDRDKDGCISELSDGAVFEGQLKCDICLPQDHRWAF